MQITKSTIRVLQIEGDCSSAAGRLEENLELH